MDPRSLDRLKSLLDRAAGLPAGDRGAFLDRECAGDSPLRDEVERLLRHHDAAGAFLPSDPSPAASPAAPAPPVAGRTIGAYTLLETLGEGGFGTVYLAQQERPIRRRVALKRVRAGAGSAEVLARFDAERQVLASMDHPNIAVALDAGVTDEGDPYFVMEHVAGLPITKHADEHRLDVDERLRLFRQVCEAVQHAHQKGVIHRDLKPSNVLVARIDGRDVVKVIDFGVAKALGARFTERTLHTQAGVVVGTPEYMSPEQAASAGAGVDTRSDVYSLGVLLFELLAGVLPFERGDTPDGGLLDLLQRIRDTEPPRLAARLESARADAAAIAQRRGTDASALARRFRGDLEAIVAKALAKEPSRRYSSAATLAEDVGRHLADLPILARAPSTAYQVRKLVARHRGIAMLGAAFLLAIVAFGISMSVLYDRQRTERRKAEHVSAFLREMLSASDPAIARGERILARDILDRAAERVSRDPDADPEVTDAVLATLVSAYGGLGLPGEALPLARARVALAERRRGREGRDAASARVALANALLAAGHADSALAELDVAGAILARRRDVPPEEVAYHRGLRANTLGALDRLEEAEQSAREAIDRYRAAVGTADARYAGGLVSLYEVLRAQGRLAEAEAAQREALAIHRAAGGPDHPSVLTDMSNLAHVLKMQRKYAEAESLYRETIALERRVLGDDHPDLATGLNNLAVLVKSLGRYDEAEPLYLEGLAIQRRILGDEHPAVATSLGNLGALYFKQDRFEDAERLYRESLAIRLKAQGEEHGDVAITRHLLAGLLYRTQQLEAAEEMERRALETNRRLLGPAHPDVARFSQFLAQVLLKRGRPDQARAVMQECVTGQAAATDPDAVALAWSRNLLGQCALAEGDAAGAESLLTGSVPTLLADAAFAKGSKRAALQATIDALESLGRRTEAAAYRVSLDSLAAPSPSP